MLQDTKQKLRFKFFRDPDPKELDDFLQSVVVVDIKSIAYVEQDQYQGGLKMFFPHYLVFIIFENQLGG